MSHNSVQSLSWNLLGEYILVGSLLHLHWTPSRPQSRVLQGKSLCCIAWLRHKLHHRTPHRSALPQSSHPSDWLWTWLDVIKTIQSRQSGCSVSARAPFLGAICLVAEDHWAEERQRYWFSAAGGQGCSSGFGGPAPQGSLQGEKGGVGHSCCLESCRQTLGQSFNLH